MVPTSGSLVEAIILSVERKCSTVDCMDRVCRKGISISMVVEHPPSLFILAVYHPSSILCGIYRRRHPPLWKGSSSAVVYLLDDKFTIYTCDVLVPSRFPPPVHDCKIEYGTMNKQLSMSRGKQQACVKCWGRRRLLQIFTTISGFSDVLEDAVASWKHP